MFAVNHGFVVPPCDVLLQIVKVIIGLLRGEDDAVVVDDAVVGQQVVGGARGEQVHACSNSLPNRAILRPRCQR